MEKCLVYQKEVIHSYVVEVIFILIQKDNRITDFISFYSLETNCTKGSKSPLKIAMLFYYAFTETPFENLINDITYIAKNVFSLIIG